jgi:6-phosphogluconolactonase
MSLDSIRRALGFAFVGASLLLAAPPFHPGFGEHGFGRNSFVYVMTNQASDNTILVFHRNADGSLSKTQEVSTQGQGTGGGGDPLGSQGALTLSGEGRLLLAVNAGSNEVSSLAVTGTGLRFVSKVASGGMQPISVASRGDWVYVLNAGGTPNVTTFRIGFGGRLVMVPNSTRPVPGGANSGPAQVGVTPDGETLVVTEKNTNQIDLFPLDGYGHMSASASFPSSGAVPFGFTFGRHGTLIVSEAPASAVSSYRIQGPDDNPTLQTITASLPDSGAAACWVAADPSGRFAFVSNSGTSTISSLAVSPSGALQLLESAAANTGSGTAPIDLALTRDGRFLYVISTSDGTLVGFKLMNGQLTQVASVSGLPLSIQGIAAR